MTDFAALGGAQPGAVVHEASAADLEAIVDFRSWPAYRFTVFEVIPQPVGYYIDILDKIGSIPDHRRYYRVVQ